MNREQQVIKYIKEALSEPQLYSEEEIHYMKKQLRMLEEQRQHFLREERRGFGS